MAKEIERKYLVTSAAYRHMASRCSHIVQGYLSTDPRATVRARIIDSTAFITVKGLTCGAVRDEWEYPVPVADARAMIDRCCAQRVVEKNRYYVEHGGLVWEVDEFEGRNAGLVIAEVELPSADFPLPELPCFVGEEVTGDPRYYNSSLAGLG